MSRSIQSWIGIACILLIAPACRSDAGTVVQPVVDHPGACAYCDVVVSAFAEATESIDILLSNAEIADNPLLEPLADAHRRGVRVRVLLDESDWSTSITAKNRPTVAFLTDRGIEARFDDPSVTTHAKLVLVDGETVILGSSNWNRYAFTDQEQTNVRIVDRLVAEAFTEWFEGLWAGNDVALESPPVAISGHPQIAVLPDGDGSTTYASSVISLLDSARSSVHVALYRMSFYPGYSDSMANELVAALLRAAGRGLDVRVLLDDCSFYKDSADANLATAIYLFQHGIPVRLDAPEKTMHAKLLVIDGKHTIVGSTNWNYYALERNNEADVALLFMPEVAATFESFFETVWLDGRTVGSE